MRLTQWLLLCLVFTLYLMLGGLIFMSLERDNETKERMRLASFRNEIRDVLFQMDHQYYHNDISEETLSQIRVAKEAVLRRLSVLNEKNILMENTIHSNNRTQWDFYNSVFYGFSIVTTIGYGHMTPTTNLARCAAVLFGLIGIPLNGILLSSIGDYFSGKLMKIQNEKELTVSMVTKISCQLMVGSLFFILMPAVLFSIMEKWSYVEAIYFTCISLMTIGFGDFVPGKRVENNFFVWTYKILIILWIELGLAYLVVILAFVTKILVNEKLRSTIERQLQTINSTKDQLLKDLDEMRLAIDTHVIPGMGGMSLRGGSSGGGNFQKIAQSTGGFATGQISKAVQQVVRAVGATVAVGGSSNNVTEFQNGGKIIHHPMAMRTLSAHSEINSEVVEEAANKSHTISSSSSSSCNQNEGQFGSRTSSKIFIISQLDDTGPIQSVRPLTTGSEKAKIFYKTLGGGQSMKFSGGKNPPENRPPFTTQSAASGRTIMVDGTFNLSISSHFRPHQNGHNNDAENGSKNSVLSNDPSSYALDKIVAQIRLDRDTPTDEI